MGFTLNDLLVFILVFSVGISIAPAMSRILSVCFKGFALTLITLILTVLAFIKGLMYVPGNLQSPEYNRR